MDWNSEGVGGGVQFGIPIHWGVLVLNFKSRKMVKASLEIADLITDNQFVKQARTDC